MSLLDLDPVRASAATIGPIAPLAHKAFQPHPAGRAEEIRADLAAFERIDEDALRPTPINQTEMPAPIAPDPGARTGAAPALTASTFA